jgi:hypothetical protein
LVATLLLLIIIIFVPLAFKKAGRELVIQNNNRGMILILLSKIVWWLVLIQILNIWFSEYIFYIFVFSIVGFVTNLIMDRNYFMKKVKN